MNWEEDRIDDLFNRALEIDPPLRAEFLKNACGDDETLRRNVETLLEAHGGAEGFLNADATKEDASDIAEGPGTVIDNYKLLECIGSGGFGVVYMAEQTHPVRRRVALKIIKLGMDTKHVVARFEAEQQALAMMDHMNIAKVLGAGATQTGRPYFVMELVRGVPITEFCDQNTLSTAKRLELFISVCQAIQHAHQKGIIHRDIKPSNVMVSLHDDKPVVKVIDFGIAKATQQELTQKTVFTQFQQFIGTPAYMSPEQAGLSGLDIDTRSDVYSLGVLLYELLTGKTPVDPHVLTTGGYEEMRRVIQEVEAPRPSTRVSGLLNDEQTTVAKRRQADPHHLRRELKGDLDWVILKALEKDRTRRYETATAFADDIQRYLNSEPVSAVAPTVLYLFSKYARRHKTPIAVAASIAAMLIISTSFSVVQAARATKAKNKATAAEKLAETRLGTARQERARAELLAEDLDESNNALTDSLVRSQFKWGVNYLDQGEYREGAAYLAKALHIDPTYWPAAARLVSVMTDRGFALNTLPPLKHEDPIAEHKLDPETGLLVTRGYEFDIRVWDAWNAKLLLDIPEIGNKQMPVLGADGRTVILVDTNGVAQVYRPWDQPEPIVSLKDSLSILGVTATPSVSTGFQLLTRQDDGSVQQWDGTTGRPLWRSRAGEASDGDLMAITENGSRAVVSFTDGQVIIQSLGEIERDPVEFQVMPESVLRLTPDSQSLVERNQEGRSIRFWDLKTGQPRGDAAEFDLPLTPIPGKPGTESLGTGHGHDFEFGPNGRVLLAISHERLHYYRGSGYPELAVRTLDSRTGMELYSARATNATHHCENLVAGLSAMVINTNQLVIRRMTKKAEVLVDRTWPSVGIRDAAFSPPGDRLLLALNDHRLIMMDPRTGESLTHEGESLQTGGTAGGTGRAAHQTHFMRHGPRLAGVSQPQLVFSPEGDTFVTRYRNGSGQIWDSFLGTPLSEPIAGLGGLSREGFSADGRWILGRIGSGSSGATRVDSGYIRIFQRDIQAAQHPRIAFEGNRPAVEFSSDGKVGMVASENAVLFNAETAEVIHRIEDFGEAELSEGTSWLRREGWLSPDGSKLLISTGYLGTNHARVYNARTGELIVRIPVEDVYKSRFAGNDAVLIQGNKEGKPWATRWDLTTHSIAVEGEIPFGSSVFAVSPTGERFAVSGKGTALINAETMTPVGERLYSKNPESWAYTVKFSPDGKRLLVASRDGFVRIWDAMTGDMQGEFDNQGWSRSAAFSPDSQLIVTGGGRYEAENPLFVWKTVDGGSELVAGPMIHQNCLQHMTFSADGKHVLAGDRGGEVILWDLETQLPVIEPIMMDYHHGITRVAMNPQMSRLAASAGLSYHLATRPLPPQGTAVPDWLPILAEAVAGVRVNDAGAKELLSYEHLQESLETLRHLESHGDDDFYTRWGQWFAGKLEMRSLAPFGSVTPSDRIEELLEDGALTALQEAFRLNPSHPGVLSALARETLDDELLRKPPATPEPYQTPAEYYARKAIDLAPRSAESWWTMAEVLLRLKKTEEARTALARAAELNPRDPNVLALQANLDLANGRDEEAVAGYFQAMAQMRAEGKTSVSHFLSTAYLAKMPKLFDEVTLRHRSQNAIDNRPHSLPQQYIDLTPFFTSATDSTATGLRWTVGRESVDAMPSFIKRYGELPFDTRGIVHFNGGVEKGEAHRKVEGVPIYQTCTKIHFLIRGAAGRLDFTVRYEDGQSTQYPFTAVTGWGPGTESWVNPRPEVPIATLDFTVRPKLGAHLLGITVQTKESPSISQQPKGLRVSLDEAAQFEIGVASQGPLQYQWYHNGDPLTSATNRVLSLPEVRKSELGSYQVVVSPAWTDPALQPVASDLAVLLDSGGDWVHEIADFETGDLVDFGAAYRASRTVGPTQPVALSQFATCQMDESFHESPQTLKRLGPGRHIFQNVEFQIDGIVHLDGKGVRGRIGARYPEAVRNIPVHRKCQWLHFLHSVGWGRGNGQVGDYQVHYDDGSSHKIQLNVGNHLFDWVAFSDPRVKDNPHIASAVPTVGGNALVFLLSWPNPYPEKAISHIDFVSAMKLASPFLLGLSTE